jgi:hypothetical protein
MSDKMKITKLNDTQDGVRTIEIRCKDVSYRALIRAIRRLPGATLTKPHHNPLSDDTYAEILFKGRRFFIRTPFSDYHFCSTENCPIEIWEEIVDFLRDHQLHWWEKIF